MTRLIQSVILLGFLLIFVSSVKGNDMDSKGFRKLNDEERRVIIFKGTEAPFSGEYNDFSGMGTYHCKQCNAPLYHSVDKFNSGCGWPSFDDEIAGAIRRERDKDGIRTEILCANCGAHLGHVFEGEGLTDKNIRHCVNSISMVFVPENLDDDHRSDKAKAYFAGGCFWGVEHLFQQEEGVISVTSGYMGGFVENPRYEEVCDGNTGHLETVEVIYDTKKTDFESLARLFFEIHDPTQKNGQGPDIGQQYHSAIFFNNYEEKDIATKLIEILKKKGFDIVTKLIPAGRFWEAEGYHQDYYERHNKRPYCHFRTKRF